MRHGLAAILAALTLAFAAPAARAGDASGALAPYEDLTAVVADLTWHLRDDVYRFPPPRDPTGHDLYRLSLERLQGWEQRFPGRLRDVTTFGRAQALERLREYAKAADAYRLVASMSTPLAERARIAGGRAATFAATAALPEDGSGVVERLAAVRKKLDAWDKLLPQMAGTPHEALVLVEEERLETLAAATVVANRAALEDGTATAERALRFVIQKHADSKNLPRHILRLADLYADLAREYVLLHDRQLAFDPEEFTRRADRALDVYRKVATWDGTPEKPEGQGRFAAFEAYKTQVLTQHN